MVEKLNETVEASKPPAFVVIQLSGGNDFMSTVIPFKDSHYFEFRKTVGISDVIAKLFFWLELFKKMKYKGIETRATTTKDNIVDDWNWARLKFSTGFGKLIGSEVFEIRICFLYSLMISSLFKFKNFAYDFRKATT